MPVAAREFVHRQHRVVARVIGVVAGRPVHRPLAVHDGVVVRQRNRFGMRDQKSVEMAGLRRPGAHPRARARAIQIDRAARAPGVAAAIRGKMLLVRTPAEFRGLRAFADETVHRPGIDELVQPLGHVADLGVALGDVDDLDAERLRELRPLLAARRGLDLQPQILGNVEQRLLDQVRHQTGIRAMREHGGRRVFRSFAQRERLEAHGVVAARVDGQLRVGVAPRPGLYAGIEIQRAALARQFDERDARHVDGQIQQEIARLRAAARACAGSCRASARS